MSRTTDTDKEDAMQAQAPSMLKPALISGVAFGIAGAIPVLNWINCACCALIIGCGFFAAFLQSKQCREVGVPFRAGNGAAVGLASGVVCGLVSGVLNSLISLLTGMGDWQEAIQRIQASGADIDPEALERMSDFMESSGPLVIILFIVFVFLLFGCIFGAIGGAIGGSVFKVKMTTAPGSTPPPPPVG